MTALAFHPSLTRHFSKDDSVRLGAEPALAFFPVARTTCCPGDLASARTQEAPSSLVPKLHLGTPLFAKLRFFSTPVCYAARNGFRKVLADCIWNHLVFAAYRIGQMENALSSAAANEDTQLILKVAQGDRSAFGALYDRFSTPLYSLALKMLANEAEAQDLLQEVFLSVWNKAPSFRADRGSAFSWVVTQLRNRAIDRLRSRRRHGELLEANAPDLEPTGSITASSSENAETSERAREVRSALGQLSDDQRQVLRLAFFEGLTQTEIAEKLEEPLGTIKARAHRGMARLRTILRGLE